MANTARNAVLVGYVLLVGSGVHATPGFPVPADLGADAAPSDTGAGLALAPASNTGILTTGIPIDLPPGRAGMTPAVALQYSSEGGYGALGLGWQLSGESISRSTRYGCPLLDLFELDGEPLVKVGNVYHTLHESFRRIKFDSGQNRWTVEEPSGIIKTFGKDAASRETGAGNTFRWHLSEVRDRYGNLIQYFFVSDSSARISEIRYTTHDGGVSSPQWYKVSFTYSAGTHSADNVDTYAFCTKQTPASQKLDSIDVKIVNNGTATVLRHYDLKYSASTTRYRALVSVKQTHATGLPGTEFGYVDGNEASRVLTAGPGETNGDPYDDASGDSYWLADFTGDGLADMLLYNHDDAGESADYGRWYLYPAEGSTIAGTAEWTWANGDLGTVRPAGDHGRAKDGPEDQVVIGDFTGDGLADVLHYKEHNNEHDWILMTNTGAGFSVSANPYSSIHEDINMWDGDEVFAVNWDSSGKTDIFHYRDNDKTWTVIHCPDTTCFVSAVGGGSQYDMQGWDESGNDQLFPGDFDGDGKTDILFYDEPNWKLWRNVSPGFVTVSPQAKLNGSTVVTDALTVDGWPYSESTHYTAHIADVNGDGKSDVIAIRNKVAYKLAGCHGNNQACTDAGAAMLNECLTHCQCAGNTTEYCRDNCYLLQASNQQVCAFNCGSCYDDCKGNYWDCMDSSHMGCDNFSGCQTQPEVGYEACIHWCQGNGYSSLNGPTSPEVYQTCGCDGHYYFEPASELGIFSDSAITVYESTGRNFVSQGEDDDWPGWVAPRFDDVNADGRSDMMAYVYDWPDHVDEDADVPWALSQNRLCFFGDGRFECAANIVDQQPILATERYEASDANVPSAPPEAADINGDLLPDFVAWHAGHATWHVYVSIGETAPRRVNAITTPLGGTETIQYTVPCQSPLDADELGSGLVPARSFAVFKVETYDGIGSGLGRQVNDLQYRYREGRYDIQSREFRGYGVTGATDWAISDSFGWATSGAKYYQDDVRRGLPEVMWRGTTIADSDLWLFNKSLQSVEYTYLADAYVPYFTPVISIIETTNYGDVPMYAGTAFVYDPEYGSITERFEYGELTLQDDAYVDVDPWNTLITATTYVVPENAETSPWLLERPRKVETYDAPNHMNRGNGGTFATKTLFAYDGQNCTDQPLPSNQKGVLTRACQWDSAQGKFINQDFSYDPTYGTLTETFSSSQFSSAKRRKTILTYDSGLHSLVTSVTDALGHTETFDMFDYRTGQPQVMVDANDFQTNVEYDAFGRLVKIWGPLDVDYYPDLPIVQYEYIGFGNPNNQSVTETRRQYHGGTDAIWSKTFLDGLGRVIQTADEWTDQAQDVRQTYWYNGLGHVAATTNPYLGVAGEGYKEPSGVAMSQVEMDVLGRPITVATPDHKVTNIDYIGWAAQVTPPANISGATGTRTYAYDAWGRLNFVWEPAFTAITTYDYDVLGRLKTIEDAVGNPTRYTYDDFGRVVESQDPDLGRWLYEYSDDGDLLFAQSPSQRAITGMTCANKVAWTGLCSSYQYDGLGRMVYKTLPASLDKMDEATFTYDALGQITNMADASGVSSYWYTEEGNVQSVEKIVDGTVYKTDYEYTALGLPRIVTYPNAAQVLYAYDNTGRVNFVMNYLSDVKYAPSGQIKSLQYQDGTTTTYTYDDRTFEMTGNKTTGITNSTGTQMAINTAYRWDNVGNLASISGTSNQSFGYDAFDRLTSASGPYGTLSYEYDNVGRFKKFEGMTPVYDTAHPHAMATFDSYTKYTYDPNGNRKTASAKWTTQNFAYTAENMLASATRTVAGVPITTQYTYDGMGNRAKKVEAGQTTRYFGDYVVEADGTKTLYVRLGNQLVARQKFGGNSATYVFYHNDHLGGTQVTSYKTAGYARLGEQYTYRPFGQMQASSGPLSASKEARYRFTGQEWDDKQGLYNYNARMYSAAGGAQFLSPDTWTDLSDPQSLNRYAYVLNNPLRYVDTTGHAPRRPEQYASVDGGGGGGGGLRGGSAQLSEPRLGELEAGLGAAQGRLRVSPGGVNATPYIRAPAVPPGASTQLSVNSKATFQAATGLPQGTKLEFFKGGGFSRAWRVNGGEVLKQVRTKISGEPIPEAVRESIAEQTVANNTTMRAAGFPVPATRMVRGAYLAQKYAAGARLQSLSKVGREVANFNASKMIRAANAEFPFPRMKFDPSLSNFRFDPRTGQVKSWFDPTVPIDPPSGYSSSVQVGY